MTELSTEIQSISEHAEKCVNYPIGEKLSAFLRHQENEGSINFALSGVLIHAAAKIFGRNVDYLEQEILGLAKNFENIDASKEGYKKKDETEAKKTRTKKFNIKDAINIDKVTFEEKEIIVSSKNELNKITLASPSRISRLHKMKEFFAKNKSKSGKLPIPKSMLLDDFSVSNFGGTLIHDYDDYKEIVGSRKDFTSYGRFINSTTGELQSDINFDSKRTQIEDFILLEPPQSQTISDDEIDKLADITLPTPPPSPVFCETHEASGKVTPVDSNINIDEGIDMDDSDRSSLLLSPLEHEFKLPDISRESPSPFPPEAPETESVATVPFSFDKSIIPIRDSLLNHINDFELPVTIRREVSEITMANIFMIPLKRLKHKCLFDLPDNEFKEMKRRKMDQWRSTVLPEVLNPRVFKVLEMPMDKCDKNIQRIGSDDDAPFLGFTKEQQNTSLMSIDLDFSLLPRILPSPLNTSDLRKSSNEDSGFESDYVNTSNEDTTFDTSFSQNNTVTGLDSCYQSIASGVSGETSKLDLPSFLEEYSSITLDESETGMQQNISDEQSQLESEERVQLMKQSAMNVAKWKEFLKPILAESEKRSKIDMHEYGLKVINKIGNVNETKTFEEITAQGQTPAYFLTMLQLINNRNISVSFENQCISAPTATQDIKITLKSKVVHKEKFDKMGEQFNEAEENKKINLLKRKAAMQTSTPSKRNSIMPNETSLSFNNTTASASQNVTISGDELEDPQSACPMLSQASSGYFSQNSSYSDC